MSLSASEILRILFVAFCLCLSSISDAHFAESKGVLFKKLQQVRVDQVVEIPYNPSLVGALAGQMKFYNISEMQGTTAPKATRLRDEFYHDESAHVDALNYHTGKGRCDYKQAFKVNETLVCYVSANEPHIRRAGAQCETWGYGKKVSHCFVFAHSVEDIVLALSGN